MNKQKLLIVEGAQGTGKTSICSILRNDLTSTNLHCLSGVKNNDRSASLSYHAEYLHLATMLHYANTGLNMIFERSYLSEKVYCNLGFKKYDFQRETDYLNSRLIELSRYYDVYFVVLHATKKAFEDRLKRDKPTYQNASFSADNSMSQQNEYINELNIISKISDDVNTRVVTTDFRTPQEVADIIKEFMGVI